MWLMHRPVSEPSVRSHLTYCIINCPHWGYSMFKTVEVWMRTHVKWPATLQH